MASAPEGRVARLLRTTSLHAALATLGDWWSVLLVREAFLGVRHFDDFQARLGIPRQTLANRLRELVGHGLLHLQPYQQRPLRLAYRLTAKGLDLYPYALLLWKWQRRWGPRGADALPTQLLHRGCGQPTTPVFACGHCRQAVTIRDVEWHDAPAPDAAPAVEPAAGAAPAAAAAPARGKRHTVSRQVADQARLYEHGAFIVADRWSHLIIACAFLGVTTFDGFAHALGIAPNILAQRLRLLVDARLLNKLPDPQDARRFQYRLTDRSRDLYPVSMLLTEWADRWAPGPLGPPMRRVHRGCGHTLQPVVLCSACGGELRPREVHFDAQPAHAAHPLENPRSQPADDALQ